MFGIPRATLQQQYNEYKNFSDDQKVSASLARKHGFVTVFSPNEEAALVTYLITASNMCYGLTEIEARKLAYQFALANKKKMPQAWVDHEKAGKEWMYGFKSRSPTLSLRKPEATSLSQATSFNPHNVMQFFNNLRTVLEKKPL